MSNTGDLSCMYSVHFEGFLLWGEKTIIRVFMVHSPPQAGTPQSSGSQRATSDQDSDCVLIQVFLQHSQLKYG